MSPENNTSKTIRVRPAGLGWISIVNKETGEVLREGVTEDGRRGWYISGTLPESVLEDLRVTDPSPNQE